MSQDQNNNSPSNGTPSTGDTSSATSNTKTAAVANKRVKIKKPQGPIRWNAIIPFVILCALFYIYFFFFFDTHIRKAIEWGGYKALGTELNIGEFKSSFLKGNVQINKIELTDAQEPLFNSIELGSVRFDLNWDALLRLKLVVEEVAVEGVQFKSKRAHAGKVAPPPPPSESDNGPSFASQLQDKAVNKLEGDNKSNVLGDVAGFLKSGSADAQLKNLQGQMASKKLLEEMNTKWTQKKNEWDNRIKSLPTGKELNVLKDRFGKIKYKDFKTPQELEASLKEIDSVVKEVDSKNKQIQEIKTNLDADLKGLDQDYKNLDVQIKKDVDTLKSHFKIPKIDASSFAKALFMEYLTPVMQKVDRYKKLAEKYLPPKYAKKLNGEKVPVEKDDDTIQPHPREKGTSYEFPIAKGYPLFWIQKVKISSSSNARADYGDFKGLISDITSNQKQIGRPTALNINGDFKSMNVSGIKLNAELNNTKPESVVKFQFGIGSYPLTNLNLMQSKDGEISIPLSNTSVAASGEIVGFKNYDLKFKNEFKAVDFKVSTPDKTITEVLNQTLSVIKSFDLEATVKGELKNLDIDIRSSLGGDLQRSFENLLKAKIAEANEKLQKSINDEIGKLKAQLQSQTDGIKNQVQGEVNKVQSQVNDQKKLADDKMNQAKMDFENQAKNKIQDEGKKQLEDLKKKFGF